MWEAKVCRAKARLHEVAADSLAGLGLDHPVLTSEVHWEGLAHECCATLDDVTHVVDVARRTVHEDEGQNVVAAAYVVGLASLELHHVMLQRITELNVRAEAALAHWQHRARQPPWKRWLHENPMSWWRKLRGQDNPTAQSQRLQAHITWLTTFVALLRRVTSAQCQLLFQLETLPTLVGNGSGLLRVVAWSLELLQELCLAFHDDEGHHGDTRVPQGWLLPPTESVLSNASTSAANASADPLAQQDVDALCPRDDLSASSSDGFQELVLGSDASTDPGRLGAAVSRPWTHVPRPYDSEADAMIALSSSVALLHATKLHVSHLVTDDVCCLSLHQDPFHLSDHWIVYTAVAVTTIVGARMVYKRRVALHEAVVGARQTLRNFLTNYVVDPMHDAYDSIRYEKSSFNIMDKGAVDADAESLGRMVTSYARVADPMLDPDLVHRTACTGDLSHIMPAYEAQIKAPLRNAILGDMVQLLLIQVQQQKVEVERALLALDTLMKSNELNFQLLAIIPALFVTGVASRYVYTTLTRKHVYARLQRDLRFTLAVMERHLILAQCDSEAHAVVHPLDNDADHVARRARITAQRAQARQAASGHIMLLLHDVIEACAKLRSRDRSLLCADLLDLESESIAARHKVGLINRMFHAYPFLSS